MNYYESDPYAPTYMQQMNDPYRMVQNQMPAAVDIYSYPQNMPMALELILGALGGEAEDRMFYDYLINSAPSQKDKNIITGIRNDEIRHFGLFNQLYYELTGQMPAAKQSEFKKPMSYCDGLERALLGEMAAVEKYRRILFAMQDRRHINILTGIITDELRHGTFYSLLFAKNKCS